VTITPESSKKANRDVMNKLRTTYGAVELNGKRGAYDGEKGLFMSGPLNFSKQQKYYVLLADECTPSFRNVFSLSQLLDTTSVYNCQMRFF
jgi:hypothetical protein